MAIAPPPTPTVCRRRFALLVLAVLALPVAAAPPAGHLTPEQVRDMLVPDRPASAAELPHAGKVVDTVDANQFTYIEVANGNERRWLAAPQTALKVGSTIRYEDGAVMTNFYSKLLQRTFPSIMFVGQLVVTAEP